MMLASRSRQARVARVLLIVITWSAFAVRLWHLDAVPPGWSDDELSNIFVISQKIFQGNYAVYYPDATGLEALYHVSAGIMLRLFGFNAIGIRLLSVLLGTIAVPLTYQMGRRLFGQRQGVVAAAALAVSFWSLIYSRVNLRHISLPVFVLLAFFFFWQGLDGNRDGRRQTRRAFVLSGLFMGIGFYSYFASRGVPLILLGFLVYLALFYREPLRRHGRRLLLPFFVALLLAIPLLITLQQLTGADARVAEVAVPLAEARAGNFEPLLRHARVTLNMFHADGDDEFLYNIPHRPVFGPVGAVFLWSGVLLAAIYVLRPLWPRATAHSTTERRQAAAAAFLLLWWIAGITPGFLSVPPASLGHTIVAQPATYLLAALPVAVLGGRWEQRSRRSLLAAGMALLFVVSVAARDLPDYFQAWPARGNVRFLYHADLKRVAAYLAQHRDVTDFAITGLLAGPWDELALEVELANAGVNGVRPRWYDPRRAIITALNDDVPPLALSGYPLVTVAYEAWYQPLAAPGVGGYRLTLVEAPNPPPFPRTCFTNGLCLIAAEYEEDSGLLDLTWQVAAPLTLPPREILSKPPPPGAPAQPRLFVFSQLLDEAGTWLTGDDGLWVNPYNLEVGDSFRQQHMLAAPAEQDADAISFGLYDPRTGERIATVDGRDHLRLEIPQAGSAN